MGPHITSIASILVLGMFAVPSTARTPENPPAAALHEAVNTDLSDYVWPTDAGNIGTSTFGEYRRTHFHGGIDISTGNRTGYKVFAVRNGYIARIRVSPTGYGKMLYVRHADGYYSTYAHLSHFNAEIDARVTRAQLKQESFPVEIDCTPNEFPVRKGEVIAYTGETGVGTPHLHFEIRDENLDPINPLLCTEFTFPDNIAPTIRKIAISPLGERSTVNGATTAHTFSVRPAKQHSSRVLETVQLTGEVGFSISVFDMSNGSRFKHGVYSHKLYIDDSLIYTVKLDKVPGKNAHEIGLYYDWNLAEQGRGRFEKLYADIPGSIIFHTPDRLNAGIINTEEFAEGPHTFRIVSTDFNTNSSEVTGKLLFNHQAHFDIEQNGKELTLSFKDIDKISKVLMFTKRNENETWTLKTMTPAFFAEGNIIRIPETKGYDVVHVVTENSRGTRSLPKYFFLHKPNGPSGVVKFHHEILRDFVRVHLQANHPFTETPHMFVYEGDSKRSITLTALDIDHYVGTFSPLESFAGTRRLVADAEVNGTNTTTLDEFELYPIVAGKSGSLVFDNGKLILSYDSSTAFKTVFMQIEKHQDSETHYSLLPENTVLRGELRVTTENNQPQLGQGLFFSGISGWELLDRVTDQPRKTLSGVITRTLGEIALRTDETPANIFRLSISGASSRRPTISFRCGDNLSGVEYKELKMYIDNVVVIPEVDGEHHKATYTATRPLEQGSHQLTIRIMDKMGNSSTVERQFSVR